MQIKLGHCALRTVILFHPTLERLAESVLMLPVLKAIELKGFVVATGQFVIVEIDLESLLEERPDRVAHEPGQLAQGQWRVLRELWQQVDRLLLSLGIMHLAPLMGVSEQPIRPRLVGKVIRTERL
ncbi:hypothetical protein D3C71_1371940 [compost metagenome]